MTRNSPEAHTIWLVWATCWHVSDKNHGQWPVSFRVCQTDAQTLIVMLNDQALEFQRKLKACLDQDPYPTDPTGTLMLEEWKRRIEAQVEGWRDEMWDPWPAIERGKIRVDRMPIYSATELHEDRSMLAMKREMLKAMKQHDPNQGRYILGADHE